MHTVELLEEALAVAEQLGFAIRQEWLSGGGGACEIKGRKWIFLDLALSPVEQLGQVVEALRSEPDVGSAKMTAGLRRLITSRRAA